MWSSIFQGKLDEGSSVGLWKHRDCQSPLSRVNYDLKQASSYLPWFPRELPRESCCSFINISLWWGPRLGAEQLQLWVNRRPVWNSTAQEAALTQWRAKGPQVILHEVFLHNSVVCEFQLEGNFGIWLHNTKGITCSLTLSLGSLFPVTPNLWVLVQSYPQLFCI